MPLPFATTGEHVGYVEPAPSLLLPLSCLLAIVVAIVVVDARLGSRLALITVGFAAAALTTRLPRILAVTAVLCLVVAGIAVLDVPGPAPVAPAAHVVMHARHHK
jgi:hypothetical protein